MAASEAVPMGVTPAVARRRVCLALRSAREAKQLTQTDVANAMEWSLSKVMRMEKGDVNVSASDLRVLLPFLDVTDPAEIKRLMDDARVARSERATASPLHREHLTRALVDLMQYEQQANEIRYYSPVLVPGILQTYDYATAVFEGAPADLSEASVKVRIETRMHRRERVLMGPRPPRYLVIIDESVVYRELGGPLVLADQLDEVLRLMEQTGVHVRILPFAAAAPVALMGPFSILDMGDGQGAVLYREGPRDDAIVRNRKDIEEHREIFERLWPLVYDDIESADLMRERAAALRAVDPRNRMSHHRR